MTPEEIAARQRELWETEGEIAIRVVEWFDLFRKIRRAADVVPPAPLIEQLRRADPQQMEAAQHWLMNLFQERFKLEAAELEKRLKASQAARSKECPYTAAEHDAAVAKVGPNAKQGSLAAAIICRDGSIGVDPKTLRKHGRPPA